MELRCQDHKDFVSSQVLKLAFCPGNAAEPGILCEPFFWGPTLTISIKAPVTILASIFDRSFEPVVSGTPKDVVGPNCAVSPRPSC